MPESTIRIRQLSDTHFCSPGKVPYGGAGYNPLDTFAAVLTSVGLAPAPDLTVVTGDLADHGSPEAYGVAVEQLIRLEGKVLVLAGNV